MNSTDPTDNTERPLLIERIQVQYEKLCGNRIPAEQLERMGRLSFNDLISLVIGLDGVCKKYPTGGVSSKIDSDACKEAQRLIEAKAKVVVGAI